MFRTRRLLRKALVGHQFGTPNEPKETLPMAVIVRHDANIPIGGRVRPAMWCQQSLVTGWPLRGLEGAGVQVLVHKQRHHAFEHGDLNLLPLPSALTVKQ